MAYVGIGIAGLHIGTTAVSFPVHGASLEFSTTVAGELNICPRSYNAPIVLYMTEGQTHLLSLVNSVSTLVSAETEDEELELNLGYLAEAVIGIRASEEGIFTITAEDGDGHSFSFDIIVEFL